MLPSKATAALPHFAVSIMFMAAAAGCARSPQADQPITVAKAESMAMDSHENIIRAIAAVRYAAPVLGLSAPAGRESDPNGAESGVHDYQCDISGSVRFDEDLKETTYSGCENTVFETINLVIDGIVDEDCRGQDADSQCYGYGADGLLTFRAYDEDEEIGGEVTGLIVRDPGSSEATSDTVSLDFREWRTNPYAAESTLVAENFNVVQTLTETGVAQGEINGAFTVDGDEGFNCTAGTLTVETLSALTTDIGGGLTVGQVQLSNEGGQAVTVEFREDGSASYESESYSGVATAELLQEYCQRQSITTSASSKSQSMRWSQAKLR